MKDFIIILFTFIISGCSSINPDMDKAIFLHHSTGQNIWLGNTNRYLYKLTRKGDVQKYLDDHNRRNKTDYKITEQYFPKSSPYGWNNYPFDYYNIWVKNAGENPFMEEPTLEILTKEYNVIIFKHCFPVSRLAEDTGSPDIESAAKTVDNYKVQYNALKKKMREFPNNKFIVWTPAVNTKTTMTEEEAIRTRQFREWMLKEWDEKGDNIFIWDFYKYETEGGLYLSEKNAVSPDNPHPNSEFSAKVAPLFCQYVIDVIESAAE